MNDPVNTDFVTHTLNRVNKKNISSKKFVHAYCSMQKYTVRAQTGGKILVMPEHF